MKARIVITLIACAIVTAAVAGCGKNSGPQTAPPSFATDASPSAPGGDTVPSGQPTGAAPTKTGGAAAYPAKAADYGRALLTALGAKDKPRVNQLAQQTAVMQLETYFTLDGHWNPALSCQVENGTHTVCAYRNAHGDEASIRMVNTQLGHPTAVTEALIDKTTYPASADGYAQTFAGAWQQGNTERMRRLSNGTVVSFFNGKVKAAGYTAHPQDAGSHWMVKMEGLPLGGFSFTVRIAKTSLGKAGAIVSVAATP